MTLILSALLLLTPPPRGITLLPDWARPRILEALEDEPPPNTDAWVVLRREEVSYLGDGRIRTVTRRILRIESERGIASANALAVSTLGGKVGRVRRIHGFNLRPGGDLETLDNSDIVSADTGYSRLRAAAFTRAQKGSWIAVLIEIDEESPVGPVTSFRVMENDPVRVFELAVSPGDAQSLLDLRHFEPWLRQPETAGGRLVRLSSVPALPEGEKAAPHERNSTPTVVLRFLDRSLLPRKADLASWDGIAAWTHAAYEGQLSSSRDVLDAGGSGLEALRALRLWFSRETTYRQMYLSPERGLVPLTAPEVLRRRYGDCKDLTAAFISEARARGFSAVPALARILEGFIEEDEPPSPGAFNHVIAAVGVREPTGLPSEVTTPGGRFLLVDVTERLSPMGQLQAVHRGRRILICTPAGGHWVTVPSAATLASSSAHEIEGTLHPDLTFRGRLTITEDGPDSRLRGMALESGERGLRDLCLRMLGAPEASCEVAPHPDPLDLSLPFVVRLEVVQPMAARKLVSTEIQLSLPGFPEPISLIQKAGRPRQLPVVFDESRVESHHARILYAGAGSLSPVLPDDSGVTPLRRFSITSTATRAENGALIEVTSRSERSPVSFSHSEREQGVEAVRKDRAATRRMRESGLAFRLEP